MPSTSTRDTLFAVALIYHAGHATPPRTSALSLYEVVGCYVVGCLPPLRVPVVFADDEEWGRVAACARPCRDDVQSVA